MPVSIVLPCYNPPVGWAENIIDQYRVLVQHLRESIEIILVKDGESPGIHPGDIALLKEQIPLFSFIEYQQNRGKGYALRQGVRQATGDLIIYTDIDFPYTTQSIIDVYDALDKRHCDVAIGIKNDDYYKNTPLVRRRISKILRLLTSTFLSLPVTDTQCGLKGFNRKAAPLFLHTVIDRYLFDLEFVRSCFKRRPALKIETIPLQLKEGVHFRPMSYKIIIPEMFNFFKILINKPRI